MAAPRIFVSSTCYDLKYIRENLRFFVTGMGYEAVLSDRGDVYYDPREHTHDACVSEVANCQMMVLIIGGRYGGQYRDTTKSITNTEYREAVERQIPVFTLVEAGVYGDHHLYTKNQKSADIDVSRINYPSADDVRIFEFIDEVRRQKSNNALFPFRDYADIEEYLKKQWAGMLFRALTEGNTTSAFRDAFGALQELTGSVSKTVQMVESVYRKLDPPEADAAIAQLDLVEEAREFFYLLQRKTGFTRFDEVPRNDVGADADWLKWLVGTNSGFDVLGGESEGKSYDLLWHSGHGVELTEDGVASRWAVEFERWFRAFRALDEEKRQQILRSFSRTTIGSRQSE